MFAALQPRVLPTNVRTLVRLLLLDKHKRIGSQQWRDFLGLLSHIEDFKNAGRERFDNMILSTKAAHEYSDTKQEEIFVLVCLCRVCLVLPYTRSY